MTFHGLLTLVLGPHLAVLTPFWLCLIYFYKCQDTHQDVVIDLFRIQTKTIEGGQVKQQVTGQFSQQALIDEILLVKCLVQNTQAISNPKSCPSQLLRY